MTRLALLAMALAGCVRATTVGCALACCDSADCAAPTPVCSTDGQCVPGCLAGGCPAGTTCSAATGECAGGPILGKPCGGDGDCAPPDYLCKLSSHTCVAGCDVQPTQCYGGWICDYASGRCCDPRNAGCLHPGGCNGDGDCASMPATICVAGTCVPDCQQSGCTAPLVCTSTGHCGPASGTCARDDDCDGASSCDRSGHCVVLADGGPIACAGGTAVSSTCNQLGAPTSWRSCVGAPGTDAACAYCYEDACVRPGICDGDGDCHAGDACGGGLCKPSSPACPTTEATAAVAAGGFAAGHELCVRGRVGSANTTSDGNVLLHLGDQGGVYAEITPLYLGAGVARPSVGSTITLHGTVRWDRSHAQWEILPVDSWTP